MTNPPITLMIYVQEETRTGKKKEEGRENKYNNVSKEFSETALKYVMPK